MSFSHVIIDTLMEMTAGFSGDKLRALRLARGLTQAELAHRAHVRERQIIRWENAQHVPRADAVARLARVLKTPVASLFSDEEEDDEESELAAALVQTLTALIRLERRRASLDEAAA
jgi:transcriptional regulator with XRE-family HTH domain